MHASSSSTCSLTLKSTIFKQKFDKRSVLVWYKSYQMLRSTLRQREWSEVHLPLEAKTPQMSATKTSAREVSTAPLLLNEGMERTKDFAIEGLWSLIQAILLINLSQMSYMQQRILSEEKQFDLSHAKEWTIHF